MAINLWGISNRVADDPVNPECKPGQVKEARTYCDKADRCRDYYVCIYPDKTTSTPKTEPQEKPAPGQKAGR